MEKLLFKTRKIGDQYIHSRPEEDFGFDYEKHEDFELLPHDFYFDAGIVNIDELIKKILYLKSNGANYVACDWNCDHQELEIMGVEFRLATPEEITEHQEVISRKENIRKERAIKDLEEKLKKLKES